MALSFVRPIIQVFLRFARRLLAGAASQQLFDRRTGAALTADEAQSIVRQETHAAMHKAAAELTRQLKRTSPVRTGRLKRSLFARYDERTQTVTIFGVFYMNFVDERRPFIDKAVAAVFSQRLTGAIEQRLNLRIERRTT